MLPNQTTGYDYRNDPQYQEVMARYQALPPEKQAYAAEEFKRRMSQGNFAQQQIQEKYTVKKQTDKHDIVRVLLGLEEYFTNLSNISLGSSNIFPQGEVTGYKYTQSISLLFDNIQYNPKYGYFFAKNQTIFTYHLIFQEPITLKMENRSFQIEMPVLLGQTPFKLSGNMGTDTIYIELTGNRKLRLGPLVSRHYDGTMYFFTGPVAIDNQVLPGGEAVIAVDYQETSLTLYHFSLIQKSPEHFEWNNGSLQNVVSDNLMNLLKVDAHIQEAEHAIPDIQQPEREIYALLYHGDEAEKLLLDPSLHLRQPFYSDGKAAIKYGKIKEQSYIHTMGLITQPAYDEQSQRYFFPAYHPLLKLAWIFPQPIITSLERIDSQTEQLTDLIGEQIFLGNQQYRIVHASRLNHLIYMDLISGFEVELQAQSGIPQIVQVGNRSYTINLESWKKYRGKRISVDKRHILPFQDRKVVFSLEFNGESHKLSLYPGQRHILTNEQGNGIVLAISNIEEMNQIPIKIHLMFRPHELRLLQENQTTEQQAGAMVYADDLPVDYAHVHFSGQEFGGQYRLEHLQLLISPDRPLYEGDNLLTRYRDPSLLLNLGLDMDLQTGVLKQLVN